MATDRVIMEKTVLPLFFWLFFIQSFSYLQVMMTCMRAQRSSNFCQIRLLTAELDALEHLKKPHRPIHVMGKLVLPHFSQLFLFKSFSYLQVTITYIRAWMSSKFGQILIGTTELAALEHLKNRCWPFFSFHSCVYTWEIVR